jgi:hypothetical protein
MGKKSDEYDDFVVHPRYGQGPRKTRLNPEKKIIVKPGEPMVLLHWHTPADRRIPNTAVAADISKQVFTTLPITHYFDSKRTCRDCRRPFIFFAEEQRYWYEALGITIEADCVRCVGCRRKSRGIARKRQRYEDLFHLPHPTDAELLEMAECCLSMIEASIFSPRQHERVRMLLRRVSEPARHAKQMEQLRARLSPR